MTNATYNELKEVLAKLKERNERLESLCKKMLKFLKGEYIENADLLVEEAEKELK